MGPSTNSREEMTLGETIEIVRFYLNNASLVHETGGGCSNRDEFAEPRRCLWIVFIIVIQMSVAAASRCIRSWYSADPCANISSSLGPSKSEEVFTISRA